MKQRRPMITRVVIVTVFASFIASVALGQMRYSRSKPQSPTPTPTPTPMPQQKMAPRSGQIQPKQSPTPLPRNPATPPMRSNYAATPAQVQSKQVPTPTPTPRPTAIQSQRTMPQRPVQAPAQSSTLPRNPATPPMRSNYASTPAQVQPKQMATPVPTPMKPTPTPVPPPDVKAYLDRQVANSKDKKFHMTVNGKDLPLTPFHVWAQKSTGPNSTSTSISMRSDEGRIYDIDFVTTGAQVTGIRIHKINGEAVR